MVISGCEKTDDVNILNFDKKVFLIKNFNISIQADRRFYVIQQIDWNTDTKLEQSCTHTSFAGCLYEYRTQPFDAVP